jgi:hypothetical protein
MRYVRHVAVAVALGAGIAGCATAGSGVTTAPLVVAADIYDVEALREAFLARGVATDIDDNTLVTRFEDLGVVLLTQPNQEREFIRMYAVWGRNPAKEVDATWLARVNETNKGGIVKLYLDDDFDLVAEWYTEVVPGLTPDGVVRIGEAFSQRAKDAASGFSDLLE